MRLRALAWLATLLTAACSDSPTPPSPLDAGADADADDGGTRDASMAVTPAPPAAPVLTPCPDGWDTIDGDPPTCEPFPGGGAIDCGEADARFPGDAACAPVGAPCAADGWPADLPAAGVLHVQASAPAGGDGSRAMPLATIGEALAVAASGAIIAIARGTYDETLTIDSDVELRGACTAEVLLTSPFSFGIGGTVTVQPAGRARLRDLSVTSEARAGVVVMGEADLERVVIPSAYETGLRVMGGTVTGREVVVRDTHPMTEGGVVVGVEVMSGGSLSLERVVVEDNAGMGVFVNGSTLALHDFVLRGFSSPFPGEPSWAVLGSSGATIALERGSVSETENGAIVVVESETTLTASDVVIRDVVATSMSSAAIHAEDGAHAEVDRALIESVSATGLGARDGSARIAARDTVVRGSRSESAQVGRGLEIVGPASIALERTAFVRTLELGLFVTHGGELTARDLRVDETGPGAGGLFGRGIQAQLGATVTLERASLSQNREVSLTSTEPGTSLRGTDVRVTSTLERACAETTCAGAGAGTGVAALTGAYVSLERFVVTDNVLCGVQLARGGTADLSDGEVSFNAIGANVQSEGFDLERLTNRVIYHDNGVNLDASELYVPSPAVP